MSKYVAEPLGFIVEPGFQMSLQECLDGEVYYFAQRDHADFISPRFMDDLAELVSLSHEGAALRHRPARDERHGGPAGRRARSCSTSTRSRSPSARRIPSSDFALKLGLLGRESRDLRKLARFQNFERVERKLLKFYKEEQHFGA